MFPLFYLYWRIAANDLKEKFFSKSTFAGAIVLIILSIFFIAFGYSLGYGIIYSYYHHEFKMGVSVNYAVKLFLMMSVFFIMANALAPLKFMKQLNYHVLKIFPINTAAIFTFDLIIGFIDLRLVLLFEVLISLTAGTGGFSFSILHSLSLLIMSVSLIYLIHLTTELIRSFVKVLTSLLTYKIIGAIIATAILAYFFILKNIPLKYFLRNNPIAWNINSIFSYVLFKDVHWIYNSIMINLVCSVGLFAAIIAVRMLHNNLVSQRLIHENQAFKEKKKRITFPISIFPDNIRMYLMKDMRYISRSNRVLTAVFVEIIIICVVFYFHFTHSRIYDHFLVAMGFIIIGPVMLWDFYLSNYWGFEKIGFGFYLFSPAEMRYAILSKNISFIFVKSILILLMSLTVSLLYSFKYFMPVLIINFILVLIMIMFSNIIAVRNPYPVDLKEDTFSQTQPGKFSLAGFIGLLLYLILPCLLIFVIYKSGAGIIFYASSLLILSLCAALYFFMLAYSSSLLNEEKETIYKTLIKI